MGAFFSRLPLSIHKIQPSGHTNAQRGLGLGIPSAMAKNLETRPSVSDLEGDNRWAALAQKHWLKQSKIRKVKQDVIKNEIWDPLEAEGFTARSLLTLENLNILEKYVGPGVRWNEFARLTCSRYLWPTYTEDASNHHVLLIAVIVGIKKGEHLPIWGE